MRNWLNKPFPLIETAKQKLTISFLFAAFIYTFLIIYQPFGISELVINKAIYVSGFSVITLLVMIFIFFTLPLIFKKIFNPEKWSVEKQIALTLLITVAISIFNWLYDSILNIGSSNQHDFISFLFITISVGIFPILFLIIYLEKYLTNKHKIIAKKLTNKIQPPAKENKNEQIKIVSYNKKDVIELELHKFICVASEGNYANIFFYEKNNVKKKLIRNSLTKINEQLIIFDSIKRCHRSYVVNLQNVVEVGGNARNYYFHIENLEFTIPVSRNFSKLIIENLKN